MEKHSGHGCGCSGSEGTQKHENESEGFVKRSASDKQFHEKAVDSSPDLEYGDFHPNQSKAFSTPNNVRSSTQGHSGWSGQNLGENSGKGEMPGTESVSGQNEGMGTYGAGIGSQHKVQAQTGAGTGLEYYSTSGGNQATGDTKYYGQDADVQDAYTQDAGAHGYGPGQQGATDNRFMGNADMKNAWQQAPAISMKTQYGHVQHGSGNKQDLSDSEDKKQK